MAVDFASRSAAGDADSSAQAEAQIAELRRQNAELEEQVAAAMDAQDTSGAEMGDLDIALQSAEEEKAALEKEKQSLTAEVERLQTEVEFAQAEAEQNGVSA